MINKENYLQNIPQELRQYKQWLWFKSFEKTRYHYFATDFKGSVVAITFKFL